MRVLVPCPYGGLVHVRCMLERADHIARGHADPRSCIACRSEWAGGIRPAYPTELARGLPMTKPRGRWAALRSVIQFADLARRPGSDRYLTTSVYSSFELMVRAHGKSPTSSFLLSSLFSDALGLPRGAILIALARGNGKRLLVASVRCSLHSASNHRLSCSG